MKIRKVFKYATGQPIPEGAVYVNTVTQTHIKTTNLRGGEWDYRPCWLVWHYFLVEVEEN